MKITICNLFVVSSQIDKTRSICIYIYLKKHLIECKLHLDAQFNDVLSA